MKAIMISIKPKWVAKILNGEKTIEIRKTMPRCDLPIDVYIYCTKEKERLVNLQDDNFYFGGSKRLNGKVVAKFTLKKVEMVVNNRCYLIDGGKKPYIERVECETLSMGMKTILEKSCLTEKELFDYLDIFSGYAWHISNLVIFDKPKELSEFKVKRKTDECSGCKYLDTDTYEHCLKCEETKSLTKAPQSFMFVEVD